MTGTSPTNYIDYLKVRYNQKQRPYTSYPTQLCKYLIERYLPDDKRGTLLDLGCGRGEFADAFSKQGYSVLGIDRERAVAPHITLDVLECDFEHQPLPFDSGSVDIIFNKSILEHISNISHLLNECRRVLKPGGIVVSLVPDFRSQWRHFYDDWTHVRPFTLEGLTECLQSHQFNVNESQRFRQLPLLWRRPYLRPLADIATVLPRGFKQFTWVRFSQEWMLLNVAQAPELKERGHDD